MLPRILPHSLWALARAAAARSLCQEVAEWTVPSPPPDLGVSDQPVYLTRDQPVYLTRDLALPKHLSDHDPQPLLQGPLAAGLGYDCFFLVCARGLGILSVEHFHMCSLICYVFRKAFSMCPCLRGGGWQWEFHQWAPAGPGTGLELDLGRSTVLASL